MKEQFYSIPLVPVTAVSKYVLGKANAYREKGFELLFVFDGARNPLKAKENKTRAKTLGAIGVIGPVRVNYGRIIPMVDFTAQAISKIFK